MSEAVNSPGNEEGGLSATRAADSRLQLWDALEMLNSGRIREPADNPIRVLLAEDNRIDQVNIRRLLEKHGIEVTLASDGRQAVDLFVAGSFDAVLLDILMPDMDGFEAARHIREIEQPAGSRTPIIALTSYSLRAVCDKCRSVGMSGYLSKPVTSSDLRKLFDLILPVVAP